jgi:hypothetical protein
MTDRSNQPPERGRRAFSNPDHASDAAQREADRLVQLVGARALADVDPGTAEGARFIAWLATDLRVREQERDVARRAEIFEARMRDRRRLPAHRMRMLSGPAPWQRPTVEGRVADVLAIATASRCAPALDLGVAAGAGRELWDEPCASWVDLPEDVGPGHHIALTVTGESMEPLLHEGDTILVKLGAELRRGAVVVARRPDEGYVVKRVARVGPRSIELASSNPGYGSVRIPRRDDLILGTVIMRWSTRPDE